LIVVRFCVRVQSAIDNIQQSGGYHIHTGDALRYIREEMFENNPERVPDRSTSKGSNTPRIIVVITNGLSDDPDETVQQASITRDTHIHLFAVGVGDMVDVNELEAISSRPSDNYTLQVESYAVLSGIRDTLTTRICNGM